MTIINEKFTVNTKGNTDIVDITRQVQQVVYSHSLQNASVQIYVAGSTVSITNIEFEKKWGERNPGFTPEISGKIKIKERAITRSNRRSKERCPSN